MLITNGSVFRNIKAAKLPEYKVKGYREAETPKPKTSKKTTKKGGGE